MFCYRSIIKGDIRLLWKSNDTVLFGIEWYSKVKFKVTHIPFYPRSIHGWGTVHQQEVFIWIIYRVAQVELTLGDIERQKKTSRHPC